MPPQTPRLPRETHREGGVPDGLLLALIGFLLGATVLLWTGTGIAGLLAHGHWPRQLHFTRTPLAMRELVTRPQDLATAWQQVPAADLPRPGLFWGIFLGEVLVLLVLAVFLLGTFTRYRAVRAARRHDRLTAPAQAPLPDQRPATTPQAPTPPYVPQPAVEAVPTAAYEAASQTPTAAEPPAPQVPVAPQPQPQPVAAAAAETAMAVPPVPGQLTGSGLLFTGAGGAATAEKGKRLIQPAVLDAEGPVVVTCADDRTWQQTVGNRGKLGPVHVFDPEHLVDTPGRLRWAPHNGCQDPVTATTRARALLAPLRTHDVTVNDAAETLLRCWLHAAAVDGMPFRQLHRWAGGSGSSDALRVLRTARDAASGWSGELEATLHAHPERRDAAQELIHTTLSCLNTLHIRDACSPGRTDVLDLESFVAERGTLYVVGTPREDPRTDPGAMPLLTALVSSVVEHGRRMAEGSSPGRLDPPMTCVLDDIATIAPLPELPWLMAEGPAVGLPVLAVLRSEDQARHRWPQKQAETIWRAATNRLTV
ncbi:type IV secretory system conjugative DNA transfer family protein [Streptomyces sp. ICBB 8177]|uniref:type IV secretory system conjugative DNA transfer family protein n=1 Tax=Streptomyces sp. ICBB 8177 TaxID=563922 RepID=UPI000D682DC2|nr:type IV secretory system conjugative DNA transfer family protein [Streptomyces sp. ICBB 8177]PWI45658.1 type VI secretion protein [Streptomyces sp. ICBB 8177]